jgi:hypothetical protein
MTVAGAVMATLAGVSLAAPPPPLRFEAVYGPSESREQADRVIPVRVCGGGGWLVLGISSGSYMNGTYAARIGPNGRSIWERTYDLGPQIWNDGQGVAELRDGSGFVITGNLNDAAIGVFLLKVGCDGHVAWVRTYAASDSAYAADVIEASNGDLVVAGGAGPAFRDALLLRTDAEGSLRWSRRYILDNVDVWTLSGLTRLIEAPPSHGSATGDIVAVGRFIFAPHQPGGEAFALRVSGDDGSLGASPQCAALFGGYGDQRFDALESNTTPSEGFELLMGGESANTFYTDLYLVRTGASPCDVRMQRVLGTSTPDIVPRPYHGYEPRDIRKVHPKFALAVGGDFSARGPHPDEVLFIRSPYLFQVDPFSLVPIPKTGHLYGDTASGRDTGSGGLVVEPDGFLLAGETFADKEGVGDPRDLYVMRTDTDGLTGCETKWKTLPHHVPPFTVTSVRPRIEPGVEQGPGMPVAFNRRPTGAFVCSPPRP